MQAKDIPEIPVLRFLAEKGGWCNWFGADYENSVTHAMPTGTPAKVALAKMRAMIKKGLVTGCACGCRGDFEITDKGREMLSDEILEAEIIDGRNN